MPEVKRQLKFPLAGEVAGQAWREFGEVIVFDTHAEVLHVANDLAFEHVQVLLHNTDSYKNNTQDFGALFIRSEINVSYDDDVSALIIHFQLKRRHVILVFYGSASL